MHLRREILKVLFTGLLTSTLHKSRNKTVLLLGQNTPTELLNKNGGNKSIMQGSVYQQLKKIEPSVSWQIKYYPCAAVLKNGQRIERVCFVEEAAFDYIWGMDLNEKNSIAVSDVVQIEPSPYRLPASLASNLYKTPETGMGYYKFIITLKSGRKIFCFTGGFIDFPGLTEQELNVGIASIVPNTSNLEPENSGDRVATQPNHLWCVYKELTEV